MADAQVDNAITADGDPGSIAEDGTREGGQIADDVVATNAPKRPKLTLVPPRKKEPEPAPEEEFFDDDADDGYDDGWYDGDAGFDEGFYDEAPVEEDDYR